MSARLSVAAAQIVDRARSRNCHLLRRYVLPRKNRCALQLSEAFALILVGRYAFMPLSTWKRTIVFTGLVHRQPHKGKSPSGSKGLHTDRQPVPQALRFGYQSNRWEDRSAHAHPHLHSLSKWLRLWPLDRVLWQRG